jgi:ABC-2 type transport system ATP-binding protein
MNLAIETKNLTKIYNVRKAVHDLSLSIPQGQVVGFLGPNGSGKTTTMRLLLGFTRPTKGSGSVLGMDIVKQSIEIRKQVGFLSQKPIYDESLTPLQVLQFANRCHNHTSSNNDLHEILENIGLKGRAGQQIKGFSGGEMQRLGIAQALVHKPKMVILDEPVSALDPVGRFDILNIIRDLKSPETTVLFSTHILHDIEKTADYIVILKQGKVLAQDFKEQLLHNEKGLQYQLKTVGDISTVEQLFENQERVKLLSTSLDSGITTWNVDIESFEGADFFFDKYCLFQIYKCENSNNFTLIWRIYF